MTYQPTCPPRLFLPFNFIPHLWNEKLTGSLPVLRSVNIRENIGEERMFPRERQPEARAPSPLRHCYSQPRRARILVFQCSSRPTRIWIRSRILSICHVEKCRDRVLSRGASPMADLATISGTPLNVEETLESWRFVRFDRLSLFRICDVPIGRRFESNLNLRRF